MSVYVTTFNLCRSDTRQLVPVGYNNIGNNNKVYFLTIDNSYNVRAYALVIYYNVCGRLVSKRGNYNSGCEIAHQASTLEVINEEPHFSTKRLMFCWYIRT
jgi:hypothetical protein